MKKCTGKRKIGFVLMGFGLLCVLIGLGYEAISYPWGAIFGYTKEPDAPPPVSSLWVEDSSASFTPTGELPGLEGDDLTPESTVPDTLLQVGVIKILRLGRADNLVEGVGRAPMKVGIGHMEGTPLPGHTGNCVLAGHRNRNSLRHLELVEVGDQLIVEDQTNRYTYTVFQTMVVDPTEWWITEPVEGRDATLTLFTCTPYLVSTHRLAVQAELTQTTPLDP